MSIQEYIETHNLSKRVEETINAAVKAKAPEPFSFMVGRVWVF
jgi:enolase